MENNRKENMMKETNFDAVVIGGGFKGMMTAYGLRKQGMSVCIIDKGKQIGGFMSPMNWQGVDVDKGPQYLDGIGEAHKLILDEIMEGHEPLDSLNYSYGSFWNDTYTDGFAIPDYRTLPKVDKATVLFESLSQSQPVSAPGSIADAYNEESDKSYTYIEQWCKKFFQNDASTLSALNRNIATFFGRKLLLDNDISLDLKKTPLFDDILAANKVGIDHKTHNLYPLNKNLGYFKDAFVSALEKSGVDVITEKEVISVDTENDGYHLHLSDQSSLKTSAIYCAATIESTEHALLGTDTIGAYIKPVAQVFYLLEMDLEKDLPFYIMNYSEASVSRVTNFTAYANRSKNGKSILCAEVPTTTDSAIWGDPESHYTKLCSEIKVMGIDADTVCNHQAFKVPSTYRAVLCGYEKKLQHITDDVVTKYGDNVHILTPHLLTRASIMTDLTERGILS